MLCPLIELLPHYPVCAYIMIFTVHQVAFDLIIRIPLVQVVAAVGFMGKRLEIPRHVNPQVAALIELCWST